MKNRRCILKDKSLREHPEIFDFMIIINNFFHRYRFHIAAAAIKKSCSTEKENELFL